MRRIFVLIGLLCITSICNARTWLPNGEQPLSTTSNPTFNSISVTTISGTAQFVNNIVMKNSEYISNLYDGFIDFFCGTTKAFQVGTSSITVTQTAWLSKTNVLYTPGDYAIGFSNSLGGTVGMVISPQKTTQLNIGSWALKDSDNCEFKLSTTSMTVNVPVIISSTSKVTPDVGAALSVQTTDNTCYINAISKATGYSGFTCGGTGDVDAAGMTYDASATTLYLGAAGVYNVMQFTGTSATSNVPLNVAGTDASMYCVTNSSNAPTTTATPVFSSYYGGNTKAMGDPTAWYTMTVGGVKYRVPLYTAP